jgi:hypothetical protein
VTTWLFLGAEAIAGTPKHRRTIWAKASTEAAHHFVGCITLYCEQLIFLMGVIVLMVTTS